jgi:hypothetical protein
MRYDSSNGIISYVDNDLGYVVEGSVSAGGASLPTTASKFAIGCKIVDLSTGYSYVNSGTVAVPVWSRAGGTALVDPQMLQLATVSLAAADLIATAAGKLSHANGLIVVPAAPTGYVNVLHRLIVSYTFGTAAFTGGGNTTVNIGGGGAALTGLIATTSLWQSGSSVIYEFKPLSTVATPMTTAQSINLVTASAITNPGTAAGSAKVYCWYSQVAI